MRTNEEQTNYILEKYEAYKAKNQKRKKMTAAVFSAAACLVITMGIGLLLQHSSPADTFPDAPTLPTTGQNAAHTPAATAQSTSQAAQATAEGIHIPKIQLAEPTPGATMDMLAVVVIDERVYMAWNMEYPYSLPYNDETKQLLGTYLGTGDGTLNEFSDREDYKGDFASNATYAFYSVNGYDLSFRVAAVRPSSNGGFITFYDCLNGITLYNGEDLFGDRLHLAENYTEVTYQLHEDWNAAKNIYKPLTDCSQEALQAFLQAVYEAELTQPDENNAEQIHALYDRRQAHLYFRMKDGTTTAIRLFEGGLVKYAGSSANIFAVIDSRVFDPVFNAATQ